MHGFSLPQERGFNASSLRLILAMKDFAIGLRERYGAYRRYCVLFTLSNMQMVGQGLMRRDIARAALFSSC